MPNIAPQIDVARILATMQQQMNGLVRRVAADMKEVEQAINTLAMNQKRLEEQVKQVAALARSAIGGMGVGYGPGLAAPGMPGRVDVGQPTHAPSDAIVELVGGSAGTVDPDHPMADPFRRPVTKAEQDRVFYSGAED